MKYKTLVQAYSMLLNFRYYVLRKISDIAPRAFVLLLL